MKLFQCDTCAQILFFENSACTSCGSRLGYLEDANKLVTVPEDADDPRGVMIDAPGARFRVTRCKNDVEHDACNWLVSATGKPRYCRSCELTEIIPDLSIEQNRAAWIEVERAKRRLLYTLRALELPLVSRQEDAAGGLSFRFLRGTPEQPVMTGHQGGVITLDVAEANAAFRENMREKLGEAYRTVLGHLRHEIGHYYWERLIKDGAELEAFRSLFGDERADYQAAIRCHYDQGPPADWQSSFISAYAAMHPWEDWAETWAHYLHIVDTLETAQSHGLTVRVPGAPDARVETDALTLRQFELLTEGWHAVTLALNSLCRSMGIKDIYPFVLSPPARDKLRFVHGVIATARFSRQCGAARLPQTSEVRTNSR